MSSVSPHLILRIRPDATEDQAVLAYKRLAQIHHPDKGGDPAKFLELRRALKDFIRAIPCDICYGKGVITIRKGLASRQENCPKCWKTE